MISDTKRMAINIISLKQKGVTIDIVTPFLSKNNKWIIINDRLQRYFYLKQADLYGVGNQVRLQHYRVL